MGIKMNGTLYYATEDGTAVPLSAIGEVEFDTEQHILEMNEIRHIVEEISDREDFRTRVRVTETSRATPSVRIFDGSEDEATLIWPSHLSLGDPESRAIKTVLGFFCKPTPRNLELFCLLHELGHVKDFEGKKLWDYYYLSVAQDRKWWLNNSIFEKSVWTRYFVQIAYMLLPLERQATKYALKWMKEVLP